MHNGLCTISYAYNVRGWLEKITSLRGGMKDFEEELFYTSNPKSGGLTYYGGNISAMRWRVGIEPLLVRGYSFGYDGKGQLLRGTYGEGASLNVNEGRYTESQSYDKMGNITHLQRYAKVGSSGVLIDQLTLTYTGNRLTRADDACSDQPSSTLMEFKDGSSAATQYRYNSNGALTQDLNKGINNIFWNSVNLPREVSFSNGNKLTYTYSYSGLKLHTRYDLVEEPLYAPTSGTPGEGLGRVVSTTTSYVGNKIYKDGVLSLIQTE